jgi:hypothetical protein
MSPVIERPDLLLRLGGGILIRLFAATLLTVFHCGIASAGMIGVDNGGSTWIAVTWDDGELYSLANGNERMRCDGAGWAAGAQENPAYGGVSGIVCGYDTRQGAEAAAIETCAANCQLMWSGYDDDETVRNIDNGHTALRDRVFYEVY